MLIYVSIGLGPFPIRELGELVPCGTGDEDSGLVNPEGIQSDPRGVTIVPLGLHLDMDVLFIVGADLVVWDLHAVPVIGCGKLFTEHIHSLWLSQFPGFKCIEIHNTGELGGILVKD